MLAMPGTECVVTENDFNIINSLVLPSGVYVRKWCSGRGQNDCVSLCALQVPIGTH